MKWYHYISVFASGFFMANTLPHLVNGVTGNSFPTPFSDPPGVGLSSPIVNVLWASLNLLISYLLLRFSKLEARNKLGMTLLFAGIVVASIMLSFSFSKH